MVDDQAGGIGDESDLWSDGHQLGIRTRALTRALDRLNPDERSALYLSAAEGYTAQEIAASAHIPGRELAKTVMAKADGEMVMAVLPASYRVVLDFLREATGAKHVELAGEGEFHGLALVGPAPDADGLVPLEHHIVAEDTAQTGIRRVGRTAQTRNGYEKTCHPARYGAFHHS